MHYSSGVEEYLCSLVCIGALLVAPIIILFNRLQKIESDQNKQQNAQAELEDRLAVLESGATFEKPKEPDPEVEFMSLWVHFAFFCSNVFVISLD